MVPNKVEDAIAELKCFLDKYKHDCLSCDHWDDKKDVCNLYKALPPPKIIVNGCEKFDQRIPF